MQRTKEVTVLLDAFNRQFFACYFGGLLLSAKLFEQKKSKQFLKNAGINFRRTYKLCSVKQKVEIRQELEKLKKNPIESINETLDLLIETKNRLSKY